MPKPATLPEEPKAKEPDPAGGRITLAFQVGDREYRIREGSWSWRDERDLAEATNGLQYPAIRAHMVGGNPSAFYMGCLIFLALRGEGEKVTFDQAQDQASYLDTFEFLSLDKPEDDGPKDQASS